MKRILVYGLSALMAITSSFTLTGCIDEVTPTTGVTGEQIEPSEENAEALVLGLNENLLSTWMTSTHYSFGYPALMMIRNIQSGELALSEGGRNYNQWGNWYYDIYWGRQYLSAQFLWEYQQGLMLGINKAVAATDTINGTDPEKGLAGIALAYRAMLYLDLAREYEFLPNDKTQPKSPEGNDITELTVPIVTEKTTEQEARNNPRAKKNDMAAFILKDLQAAEKFVPLASTHIQDKGSIPGLDCVYGLYARYYMWLENYTEAEKYARLAINTSSTKPMTKEEALSVTNGYNDASKWMWGASYSDGNVNNLLNWVAHMSAENSYGYSGPVDAGGAGLLPQIASNIYNKISNTDWRKLLFQAPETSPLYGKNTYCNSEFASYLEPYTSLKFRPKNGNVSNYTVANVTSVPIMRVEEMYFIEAEAAAHNDPARGKALLETFMLSRDNNYKCKATDKDAIVNEIFTQKQVELWGEGLSWFDIKRLNYPVDKTLSVNIEQQAKLKTTTRPAWMNWSIVQREEQNNAGVLNYNNPDPSNHYGIQ